MVAYSLRCRNCKYSRRFGNAKLTAETRATVHALKKRHTVDVTMTVMETLTNTIIQTSNHSLPDQEVIF